VHVVGEGVLIVSPGAFKDFDAGHWQAVQGDLLAMGVHLPRGGKHMRSWNVRGRDGVFVRGILLSDASLLFESTPDVNPALVEAV
ncbi:MAG: DNA-binding domain-containing protein, partial [Mariprofundaceae bacterium]|nr:DNA-binding domain-containing protein [Mariprofundaceae bacterium]